ncbi:pyrroline-5-carboxylate reductase [Robbsia sp. Bb-Pol-6]|uniref:Pyrroline-5-carboxylate reductase n=1 Tax=Robbsia betulipollinis TaxID=2981849 RepID=A0ABT3ZQL5_9BURK|nr:pyrroline-5-carboxylate reductase [Robbsia betulipollinis]MCY0388846.1 pyrroline-5-carboxylate reductase [Robbsia betulipollinis]
MKIGFIGGGNMATALIGGLLKSGTAPADIHVVDRADATLAQHAAAGLATCARIDAALAGCDVVVFAIKPQHFREAAADAAPHVGQALVVSIAAGIRMVDVARWLGGHARVVRTMPNTPALIGEGITGVVASPDVGAEDRARVDRILRAAGKVVWLAPQGGLSADDRIDAVTGISGSGPAYVFAFIEALEDAARQMGFDAADAHALVMQTVRGAAELAARSPETPGVLRERVTSPGGTTAAALASFRDDDLHGAIVRGALAAAARAKALADELGGA